MRVYGSAGHAGVRLESLTHGAYDRDFFVVELAHLISASNFCAMDLARPNSLSANAASFTRALISV